MTRSTSCVVLAELKTRRRSCRAAGNLFAKLSAAKRSFGILAGILPIAFAFALAWPAAAAGANYYWVGGTSGNGNWDSDNGGATNWSSSGKLCQ